jgi:hypothetical protein
MRPILRQLVPCRAHEFTVFRPRDRIDGQLEAVKKNPMRRPFVFLAAIGAIVKQPAGMVANAERNVDECDSNIE